MSYGQCIDELAQQLQRRSTAERAQHAQEGPGITSQPEHAPSKISSQTGEPHEQQLDSTASPAASSANAPVTNASDLPAGLELRLPTSLPATARLPMPQLWSAAAAELSDLSTTSVEEPPQLSVKALTQMLQRRLTADSQPAAPSTPAPAVADTQSAEASTAAPAVASDVTPAAADAQPWQSNNAEPSQQMAANAEQLQVPVRAAAAAVERAQEPKDLPQLGPIATAVPDSPTGALLPAATADADLPQLTPIATGSPDSPTGALLPGLGSDLLHRSGSSPLPVSKLLRVVSEEQASALGNLAAQCAAPGGLLGAASEAALSASPQPHNIPDCNPGSPDNSGSSSMHLNSNPAPQHAQHGSPEQTFIPAPVPNSAPPVLSLNSSSQQTSPLVSPVSSSTQQSDVPLVLPVVSNSQQVTTSEARRSPLRKRLSEFFGPVLGSTSSNDISTEKSAHLLTDQLSQSDQLLVDHLSQFAQLPPQLVSQQRPPHLLSQSPNFERSQLTEQQQQTQSQ